MPRILAIDIGNTSTKWTAFDCRRIERIRRLDAPSELRKAGPAKDAVISCVAPQRLPPILGQLRRLGIVRPLLVSASLDLGIKVCCASPGKVGADRLVNAAAAAEFYGTPAIVLDIGTAVTFDVVSRRGEFLGGVIAPGPQLLAEALHERTALLPLIRWAEPLRAIGRDTAEAMRSGLVHGYRGMILGILGALKREIRAPRSLRVVVTGGAAPMVMRGVPPLGAADPQLTLRGLRLIYQRNRCSSRCG